MSLTRSGGIVEKFAGDAVMAAFGVPQAHEDDAERAVRAADAIMDSVHGLGLEARIGIESGEVVADESESTFATGEAVNVAARLQQLAEPGETTTPESAADMKETTAERQADLEKKEDAIQEKAFDDAKNSIVNSTMNAIDNGKNAVVGEAKKVLKDATGSILSG